MHDRLLKVWEHLYKVGMQVIAIRQSLTNDHVWLFDIHTMLHVNEIKVYSHFYQLLSKTYYHRAKLLNYTKNSSHYFLIYCKMYTICIYYYSIIYT